MRIRLKGINWTEKRLADGSMRTYYYAWRGGPKLPGKPGDAAFIAAYNAAIAEKAAPAEGVLQVIVDAYQQSEEFLRLADRTRRDYIGKIKLIEREYGDLPLAALSARGMRGEFLDWRDALAKSSHRQADYAWTVLARILSWALNREKIDANPCEDGGRLYSGSRAEFIWTHDNEEAFLKSAPAHLHLPFLLALWTGQRQGDLLRLPWSAYDGTHIRLRQSKTRKKVIVPVGAPLKIVLDAAKAVRVGPIMLTSTDKTPWTSDGFRSSWKKACVKAGIKELTFHDLRGTAVTRLAIAGATDIEIATITGLKLGSVETILDEHYLSREVEIANHGQAKRVRHEARTKSQTGSQTGKKRPGRKK